MVEAAMRAFAEFILRSGCAAPNGLRTTEGASQHHVDRLST
jgi:hypothetical protein